MPSSACRLAESKSGPVPLKRPFYTNYVLVFVPHQHTLTIRQYILFSKMAATKEICFFGFYRSGRRAVTHSLSLFHCNILKLSLGDNFSPFTPLHSEIHVLCSSVPLAPSKSLNWMKTSNCDWLGMNVFDFVNDGHANEWMNQIHWVNLYGKNTFYTNYFVWNMKQSIV